MHRVVAFHHEILHYDITTELSNAYYSVQRRLYASLSIH